MLGLHGGNPMTAGRILLACRVVLGALFVWAAVTKVPDMAAFAQDVANYRVVPPLLVPWAASALVGVELLCGIALIAGAMVRPAAGVIAALLAAFTVFLVQALVRGIDVRCGCFGGEERASWWTVARDVILLAAAVAVAKWPPERSPADEKLVA